MHADLLTCMPVRMQVCIQGSILHACRDASCMHADMRTEMYADMHADMHADRHADMHADIHADIHADMRTEVYAGMLCQAKVVAGHLSIQFKQ